MRDGPPGVRSAARVDSAVIALSKRTCELLTANSRGESRDRGNFYFDTRGKKINRAVIALLFRAEGPEGNVGFHVSVEYFKNTAFFRARRVSLVKRGLSVTAYRVRWAFYE